MCEFKDVMQHKIVMTANNGLSLTYVKGDQFNQGTSDYFANSGTVTLTTAYASVGIGSNRLKDLYSIIASVRREKATNKLVLCFYCEDGLCIYDGIHNTCDLQYYRQQTTIADYNSQEVKDYLKSLILSVGYVVHLVKRLKVDDNK